MRHVDLLLFEWFRWLWGLTCDFWTEFDPNTFGLVVEMAGGAFAISTGVFSFCNALEFWRIGMLFLLWKF